MKSPLERIEVLIPVLPQKDAQLASVFLKERNFQGILELVESDIYKARRKTTEEEGPDESEAQLIKLKSELLNYMSFLDLPDDFYDFEDY